MATKINYKKKTLVVAEIKKVGKVWFTLLCLVGDSVRILPWDSSPFLTAIWGIYVFVFPAIFSGETAIFSSHFSPYLE